MEARRKGREGSRWYNERPSADDVAKWFTANVAVEEGLQADDYISGITLISAEEKTKEVIGFRDNGTPIIQEVQNIVYVPYPRVDTRIKYFHDLMALKQDEWYGVIEPVPVELPRGVHLPPGFFPHRVRAQSGDTTFVCCSMKVTVWKREGFEETWNNQRGCYIREGERIIDAPPATKMVASSRKYADGDALMKAETGAVGRALGMAGILVVAGAGVATAEDLQDLSAQERQPPIPEPKETPQAEPGSSGKDPTDDELRQTALKLIGELKAYPKAYEAFLAWAKERKLGDLSETVSPTLKGVVRQLERKLDEVRSEAN